MKQLRISHRKINNLLGVTVIVVALYALLIPFLPMLTFRIRTINPEVQASISRQVQSDDREIEGNRLLLPGILVDEEIVTGDSLSVINDGGVWLRPASVAPDQDGNIILAGHRFTYNQPYGPLYHLDKVAIGDEVGLYWEGEMRQYIVTDTKTVTDTSIGIEQQTGENKLTIYTCSPLLTAEHRLVITAEEVL